MVALTSVWAFTIGDYALSWDEPTRWRSGDVKVDYYDRLFASKDKLEVMRTSPRDLYPGFYDIPLALVRRTFPDQTILLSRIFNVSFGAVAVLASICIARILLNGFTGRLNPWIITASSLLSGVILLAIPEFYGHIFINPKDVPFAAMYSVALLALLRLAREFPNVRRRSYVMFALATGLVMATRPPGIVFLAYFGVAATAWSIVGDDTRKWTQRICSLADFTWRGCLVALVALCVLFPWWPRAHRNPFMASSEAVSELNGFSATIPVLYDGQIFDAGTTPRFYVFWMFLIKMPEWFLLLLLGGAIAAVVKREKIVAMWREDCRSVFLPCLALFTVFFPVLYVFVRHPAIHNGYRHMLYVLPTMTAFGSLIWAFGINAIWGNFKLRILGISLSGLCVFYSISVHVRLHPYQYVYYNSLIGGPEGSLGKYETEYWFTSGREALDVIREYVGREQEQRLEGEIRLFVSGPWQVLDPYLTDGYTLSGDAENADFYIGNSQMRMDTLLEGKEIGRVERMGLPICIVKKLVRNK